MRPRDPHGLDPPLVDTDGEGLVWMGGQTQDLSSRLNDSYGNIHPDISPKSKISEKVRSALGPGRHVPVPLPSGTPTPQQVGTQVNRPGGPWSPEKPKVLGGLPGQGEGFGKNGRKDSTQAQEGTQAKTQGQREAGSSYSRAGSMQQLGNI